MEIINENFHTPIKKKIAIYGGSFDPPTLAHEHIIETISPLVDEVWVLPAYIHTIKKRLGDMYDSIYQKHNSDFLNRFALCTIAFNKFHNVKVLPLEYTYNKSASGYYGQTKILLDILNSEYPDYTFTLVIGQDNAEHISEWMYSTELLSNAHFIVISRDTDTTLNWYKSPPHVFIKTDKYQHVSSSKTRTLLDIMFNNGYYYQHEKRAILEYINSTVFNFITSTNSVKFKG